MVARPTLGGATMRAAAVAMCALAAVSCDEVLPFGPSGTSDTVEAPPSIIGREVRFTIGEALNSCTAPAGTTYRLMFIDADTIRGVRDDGAPFDYPTRSWSYQRTGDRSGTINLAFTNNTVTDISLVFESDDRGTYEQRDTGANTCDTHARGTFMILG